MITYNKYICDAFLIGVIAVLVGCATPPSVRSLSEEQIKAQDSYLQSQKQYFSVIEKYVDVQTATAEALILSSTKELNEKYKKQALSNIDPTDKVKTQNAINELSNKLLAEQQSDQKILTSVKKSVDQLKELHRQMLSALVTIMSAQRKLNEYIQLQKADEQAVNQLLSAVGLETGKIDKAATMAAEILASIEKTK
jgi:hypothetical protein